MRIFLSWNEGTGQRRVELGGQRVLGRVNDSNPPDQSFSLSTISRRHCQLVVGDDGSVTLRDLASMNGTWIGDTRITSPTIITNGQTFEIGRVAPNPAKHSAGERGFVITVEIVDNSGDDPNKTSTDLGRPTTLS